MTTDSIDILHTDSIAHLEHMISNSVKKTIENITTNSCVSNINAINEYDSFHFNIDCNINNDIISTSIIDNSIENNDTNRFYKLNVFIEVYFYYISMINEFFVQLLILIYNYFYIYLL